MPSCFVISCKSGYTSNAEKVPTFRPPRNPEQFQKWKRALPKRDIEFSDKANICAKHFKSEEIVWHKIIGEGESQMRLPLIRPKLAKNAVPSIFPNVHFTYIPRCSQTRIRKPPKERKTTSKKYESVIELEPEPVEISTSTSCIRDPIDLSDEFQEQEKFSLVFSSWDAFDQLDLPTAWTKLTTNEIKSLFKFDFSNHDEPRPTVIKEVRTVKNNNEVQLFILGEKFISKNITSFDELLNFVTEFLLSTICRGWPPSAESNVIKVMKQGRKNILNRWQSTNCNRIIPVELKDAVICAKCIELSRALGAKVARL